MNRADQLYRDNEWLDQIGVEEQPACLRKTATVFILTILLDTLISKHDGKKMLLVLQTHKSILDSNLSNNGKEQGTIW